MAAANHPTPPSPAPQLAQLRAGLALAGKLIAAGVVLSWLVAIVIAWTISVPSGTVEYASEVRADEVLTTAQRWTGPWATYGEITWEPGGKRDWGPEQASGPPDAPSGADHAAAWAPLSPDAGTAWLRLEWLAAIRADRLTVHQSFNPGAIVRIEASEADGSPRVVWSRNTAEDATAPELHVALDAASQVQKVTLYLDLGSAPGWNEIDAAGLRDRSGVIHYAQRGTSSTSYADRLGTFPLDDVAPSWCSTMPPAGLARGTQTTRRAAAFGWPFRAWVANAHTSAAPAPLLISGPRMIVQPAPPGPLRIVPVRPLVLGILANAAIYAGILAVLWLLLLWPLKPLRRVLRMQRGHCPDCGFDLRYAFSAGCPECGFLRA